MAAIQQQLLAGYGVRHPDTNFPAFAFRLHQFISRGETVYASIQPESVRHVTLQPQKYVPGDRSRVLLPLVFCRECGQEYYCVRSTTVDGSPAVVGRRLDDREEEEGTAPGYLYLSESEPWPSDPAAVVERLPDDWVEEHQGATRVRAARRKDLPQERWVAADGRLGAGDGVRAHFIPVPFRFCLACGVSYGTRQRSDFAKLTTLGSEGRSTATTILSLSAIRSLRRDGTLRPEARKLLSFTDNRQDASLQAGHFNDFLEIGLLRSALYRAVLAAGDAGITHEVLTQQVFDALDLPLDLYAADPGVRFQALNETQRALRDVLGYRLYLDLRRGWRITSPNLEQCGLLEITYESLEEVCAAEDVWAQAHPALSGASPSTRAAVAKTLLDYMRRELAIKVNYLSSAFQETLIQLSSQRLGSPWALDENERLERATVLFPRSSRGDDWRGWL
ncbi:MAG: DEAD/DEAH box helicase, partial [Candidatus Methylomirabilales bacterium]